MYNKMPVRIFDERMSQLDSHKAIIQIFDDALSDTNWPTNDHPSKQELSVIELQAIRKSGWCTSGFQAYNTPVDHVD
jgi:hypothetical protein